MTPHFAQVFEAFNPNPICEGGNIEPSPVGKVIIEKFRGGRYFYGTGIEILAGLGRFGNF